MILAQLGHVCYDFWFNFSKFWGSWEKSAELASKFAWVRPKNWSGLAAQNSTLFVFSIGSHEQNGVVCNFWHKFLTQFSLLFQMAPFFFLSMAV